MAMLRAADDDDVSRHVQRLAIASLGALVLSGCGGEQFDEIDVSYGGECVVEIELERGAAQDEFDAFKRRVEGIAHVDRIQVLSRAGNIGRFREAIRHEGHAGKTYDQLMARARRHAGRVLLVKAEDDRHVPAILRSLQELPAAVSSVAERDSCHSAS
jgi:hypothetical protein